MTKYRRMRQRPARPETAIDFDGFPFGLNSAIQPHQILPKECAELVNFKINRGGQLQTRQGLSAHTTTAVGAITAHGYANIGGTNRELIVDADKKLYYNDSGVPTQIGGTTTLSSSDAFIFAYKGVALICDGSYLKYCDGVGATNLKMAYDDGSGTRGYQVTNLTGHDDTSLALGNGTITRVAYKFTSQSWDAGYTIPPTTIEAYLTKTGSPTGDISAKIRAVSGDAILATGTISAAADLTGTAEKYEAVMTVTTELSPSTQYYLTLEYSGGDVGNYVNVRCTSVASAGGLAYTYAGSYTADTAKTPLMGCSPGRPPKCSFGDVHGQRPWLSGDPDNPGYVWYGGLTYLDFSSANLAGFIGAVDADANNYAVGAIKSFYGDLYVFGSESQPYLAKLTGTTPSDWALPALYQRQSATKRTLVSAVNDIWFASNYGVDALSGVTEYGDLRTFSYSDPVADRLLDHWVTSTAHAGYNPMDGQYLLSMPSYHRVLCCHTKAPTLIRDNEVRYPWAEYEFTREHLTDGLTFRWTASSHGTNEFYAEASAGGTPSIVSDPDFVIIDSVVMDEGTIGALKDHEYKYGDNDTLGYNTVYIRDDSGDPDITGVDIRTILSPTTMSTFGGSFYIGSSDGLIYELDPSGYKDNAIYQLRYDFKTQYAQSKFAHVNLTKQQLNVGGRIGARLNFEVYTNDQFFEPVATYQYVFSMRDDLLLKDMTMPLVDAYFMIDPAAFPAFQDMEVNARTFQLRITDLLLSGEPVFINGLSFKLRMLEA